MDYCHSYSRFATDEEVKDAVHMWLVHNQKHSSQMASGSSWTEVSNVEKLGDDIEK
jgi:hypothetical protein